MPFYLAPFPSPQEEYMKQEYDKSLRPMYFFCVIEMQGSGYHPYTFSQSGWMFFCFVFSVKFRRAARVGFFSAVLTVYGVSNKDHACVLLTEQNSVLLWLLLDWTVLSVGRLNLVQFRCLVCILSPE